MQRQKQALALIEVVVIGIVILIGSVIWLNYSSRSHLSARRTSCIGQLKQLGLAIQQYTSEMYYGDYMRASASPRLTAQQMVNDLQLLYSNGTGLISESSIFICPVFCPDRRVACAPLGTPLSADPANYTLHYSLSVASDEKDPSNKVIMADNPSSASSWHCEQHQGASLFYHPGSGYDQTCLFWDSHVKAYPGPELADDSDPGGIYEDDPAILGGADTFIPFLSTDAQMVGSD